MEGRSKELSHTKPSVPVRRDQTISCEKKDRDICCSQGRTVILMRLPQKSGNVRPHFSTVKPVLSGHPLLSGHLY